MLRHHITLGLALVLAAAGGNYALATPGDMNCDGAVNARDVDAFVLAVIDPSGYQAAYPACPWGNANFDCDTGPDAGDIGGFVDCLLTGNCPICPPTGMVLVPAGEFLMGDWREEGLPEELPWHDVSVRSYYIDICEVSNQQYAEALNWANNQGNLITVISGVVYKYNSGTSYRYCETTSHDSTSRITWNGSAFGATAGKENHPMVLVSWYGAVAYTNWRSAMQGRPLCYDLSAWTCNFGAAGYRLPTEAEWEKAAASEPGHLPYRFGEHTDGCAPNCLAGNRANLASSGDPFDNAPMPPTTPVGYYDGGIHDGYQTQDAKSFYGCRDMTGNVWEWCNDWYLSTYYQISPSQDPTGPASGTLRVQRGGCWISNPHSARTARRNWHAPVDMYPNDGFRCAFGGL
jgi:formylglycine-generating enzyme